MENIIFGLISITCILIGVYYAKEHKKLEMKLKENAKDVEYIDYLLLGMGDSLIVVGLFILLFVIINVIFM